MPYFGRKMSRSDPLPHNYLSAGLIVLGLVTFIFTTAINGLGGFGAGVPKGETTHTFMILLVLEVIMIVLTDLILLILIINMTIILIQN